MSESTAVKEALKEARELIGKKDHKGALRCCKKAINMDKDNYMALVFSGLCLTELGQWDQALKAYGKATNNVPDQLRGWQGLAILYEKQNEKDTKNELAEVYEKLLTLYKTEDTTKYKTTSDKLVNLYSKQLKNIDKALRVLQERRIAFPTEETSTHCDIIRLLNSEANLKDELNVTLKESLLQVVNDTDSIQNREHFKLLLGVLYKIRDMEKLCEYAIRMERVFPENIYALEWICAIYLELVTDQQTMSFCKEVEENVSSYIDKLLNLTPTSQLAILAKSAVFWTCQKPENARDLLKQHQVEQSSNPNVYGTYILCHCYYDTMDYADCESTIPVALVLLNKIKDAKKRQTFETKLKLMLVKTLYYQDKFTKAVDCLKDEIVSDDLLLLKAKIYARVGDRNMTESLLDQLEAKYEHEKYLVQAMLCVQEGQYEEASSLLATYMERCITKKHGDDFEPILLEGRIRWEQNRVEDSHRCFLLAAKSNPKSWVPFLYLGHTFAHKGGKQDFTSIEKAKKCYYKSFSLNPQSCEAGAAVSDILVMQEQWEENLKFLTSVTKDSTAKWAHMRLGMHYMATGKAGQAVASLQFVLKSDPEDINAWECLADAYAGKGSFSAALKAYDRVTQLSQNLPTKGLYASLQMATIKSKLGFYNEAVQLLNKILCIKPNHVPALKCLGETLLKDAADLLAQHLDKNAVDKCQEAVCYLTRAIKVSRFDLSCLWKLLGDACSLIWSLPCSIATFVVPAELVQSTNEEKLEKLQLLELGSKCYTRALQIRPENTICWQSLATNFHYQCLEMTQPESRKKARSLCFSAIRKALSLSPKSHILWNALGVFAASDDNLPLAQHAFVQSVNVQNNTLAWINLGVVYYILKQHGLANRAFKEAQNLDPSNLRSWVGQALLAEAAGVPEEAVDLFRHSTFLGHFLEASLGYANWMCKALTATQVTWWHTHVSDNKGVCMAIDSLMCCINRINQDPCALNMLGLLLETKGLLKSAKQVLMTASEGCEGQLRGLVLQNLGRVLFKLNDFQGSMQCYREVPEANFYSSVGLAIASFKAGLFQEAYNAYAEALQMATENIQRSHVLTAMAQVAYTFHGEDSAKTLLFQSCQLQPPSVDGLFALSVLGVKQNDPVLVNACLTEIAKYDKNSLCKVNKLKAAIHVVHGHKEEARKLLSKAIHESPQLYDLWQSLAHLLALHFNESESAAKCAQKLPTLSRLEEKSGNVEAACLVGLCLLMQNRLDGALLAAKKAVHMYPQAKETWSLLATTLEQMNSTNMFVRVSKCAEICGSVIN